MDRLEAIKYLFLNGHRSNEWEEAGLLEEVRRVTFAEKEVFSAEDLDEAIEHAATN